MPALEKLSKDMQAALGKDLAGKYETLVEKSKKSAIKDDPESRTYVDAVIKRLQQIKNAPTGTAKLVATKEQYCSALHGHVAVMLGLSFSKPDAVAERLKTLGNSQEEIASVVKKMEQPGATNDDVCALLCCVVTSETLAATLSGGGHHHHHHHGHRC